MLASHMAILREVHLEAVLHVFAFLCQKYNSRMAFDPTYLVIKMNDLMSVSGSTLLVFKGGYPP